MTNDDTQDTSHLFDFSNMPQSNEQQMITLLQDILAVMTRAFPEPQEPAKSPLNDPKLSETPEERADKIKALQARVPAGRRK